MFSLYMRLMLLLTILFGIVYMGVSLFLSVMGISNLTIYIIFAGVLMVIQYIIGPKIVEWTMRVRYIKRREYPRLFSLVEDLAKKAGIPIPKIGIAYINVPNAFAFGRSLKDGRVCVSQSLLSLLNDEELKAVLGHELGHLKNRDMLFITVLSVIPLIFYRLFFHLLFFGSYSRRKDSGWPFLIAILAFIFYFITNLLLLYASRIREFFADRYSIKLGNSPSSLATALYKLVFSSARIPKETLKAVEGVKAFFLNDVSSSQREISDLMQLDIDKSGTIDPHELKIIKESRLKLSLPDRLMELVSTHPNILKRIKRLSNYQFH